LRARFGTARIISLLAVVILLRAHAMKEESMQTKQYNTGLAVSAAWEARDGEDDAVADVLAQLGARARTEPGVKLFLVHRNLANPRQFLFYELFEDEAAFDAHQQTEHFRSLVLEQGLPRLVKRERVRYALL
jgi:quinol monooxygenase YgiN